VHRAGHGRDLFACRGSRGDAGTESCGWTLVWLGAVRVDGAIRRTGTDLLPTADAHLDVDGLDASAHVEFCHQAVRGDLAGHRPGDS